MSSQLMGIPLNKNFTEYTHILVFIGVAFSLALFLLFLSWIRGATPPPNQVKLSAYECGFEAFQGARMKFDVRYYLVGLLFIIFDLEIAFLVPWAVTLRETGWAGLLSMILFLTVLGIGFVYEWKKGALEWD